MLFALLLLTAQAATVAAPAPAIPVVAAARLNLDTPVQDIAADPKGRAILQTDLPELLPHPEYESFKTMSLHQLQGYAPDKLSDTLLAKVATDLAAVK